VRAAWDGLDATKVWDAHAHLVGTGDSGSGITVNPAMESLLDPAQYAGLCRQFAERGAATARELAATLAGSRQAR